MSRGTSTRPLELALEFAERVRASKGEAPFLGAVPAWFHKPYGDGWALVGDAGYNKDPITAQGITDAFLDAERCAGAIHQWLHDGKPYNDAMSAWHQEERDAKAMPIYEFKAQLATLELPPPEMQQLLSAMVGNQEAMGGFVSVVSGALSPVDFCSEDKVGRMFAQSHTA